MTELNERPSSPDRNVQAIAHQDSLPVLDMYEQALLFQGKRGSPKLLNTSILEAVSRYPTFHRCE